MSQKDCIGAVFNQLRLSLQASTAPAGLQRAPEGAWSPANSRPWGVEGFFAPLRPRPAIFLPPRSVLLSQRERSRRPIGADSLRRPSTLEEAEAEEALKVSVVLSGPLF